MICSILKCSQIIINGKILNLHGYNESKDAHKSITSIFFKGAFCNDCLSKFDSKNLSIYKSINQGVLTDVSR